MEIDSLMADLARIPGARIGRGPRHPSQPDATAGEKLREFLAEYPAVRTDPGYVEFLECYGGAYLENEDVSQIVDILGFTDASTQMYEMDGPIVDEDGFLLFAQCVYHIEVDGRLVDTQEYDFAFDVTGGRESGVYGLFSARAVRDNRFEWHSDDFLSWLAQLVRTGGRFPTPGTGS